MSIDLLAWAFLAAMVAQAVFMACTIARQNVHKRCLDDLLKIAGQHLEIMKALEKAQAARNR